MLILSLTDLNLLKVAGTGLCFGFLLNVTLIIEHSVDNTDVFVINEKCLEPRPSLLFVRLVMLVRRFEVHGRLGQDPARTGDPN